MTRLDPRLGLVLATFAHIFLLAIQTLNVTGGHYGWAVPAIWTPTTVDEPPILQTTPG